ncbi:hypothetical protein YC2023_115940 [Brassica napus]
MGLPSFRRFRCTVTGTVASSMDWRVYTMKEDPLIKKIIVNPKIALNRLLDEMYVLTGGDKQRSKVKIFGRYPSLVVGRSKRQCLETMIEVPRKHPSVKIVELYLEVKPDGVVDPVVSSSKRQRRTDIAVKLERDNRNMLIEEGDIGNVGDGHMTDIISHKDLEKESSSSGVGWCFKDADELKKAVEWSGVTGPDECMFECVRWKCKWSLGAARMEKHGLFEIIKYTGPHTCRPIEPKSFNSEFEADETERLVRVKPKLSVAELNNWWKGLIGYEIETKDVRALQKRKLLKECLEIGISVLKICPS